MTEYHISCVRMEQLMKDRNITKLYVGHYPYLKCPLGLDYLKKMKNLAKRLSEGDTTGAVDFPIKNDFTKGKPMIIANREAMIVYDSENIN